MKKKYLVKILEQELAVLSDSGDEHVERVVQLVREKVEQIKRASGSINPLIVAILAALNIADEYISMQVINEKIYHHIENRADSLLGLIKEVK